MYNKISLLLWRTIRSSKQLFSTETHLARHLQWNSQSDCTPCNDRVTSGTGTSTY